MHIWIGFSIARDKETLLREPKQGHIITVESRNDFVSWIGQFVTAAYDLYKRVVDGIDDVQEEDAAHKIMQHPLWGDLRNFAANQIQEAKKLNLLFNKIVIECGKDYHELLDLIAAADVKMFGGIIEFRKSEAEGSSKKATAAMVTEGDSTCKSQQD